MDPDIHPNGAEITVPAALKGAMTAAPTGLTGPYWAV
jgi:hypothetical protein